MQYKNKPKELWTCLSYLQNSSCWKWNLYCGKPRI